MNKFIKKAVLQIPPVKALHTSIKDLKDRLDGLQRYKETDLCNRLEELQCYNERLERRLNTLETRLDCPAERWSDVLMLDRKAPYLCKMNQNDLANHEHYFFTAPQIVNNLAYAPYIPTFCFDGEFINENHQYYAREDDGKEPILLSEEIEGWIHYQEALKIYELVYFSIGNVLELGTYKGLSASIIVRALRDIRTNLILDTVDINAGIIEQAKRNLIGKYGDISDINFHVCDGNFFMDALVMERKKYGLIFLDGGHGYKNVYKNAVHLHKVLTPGGFALFHDYLDKRNFQRDSYYGVYQAVNETMLVDDRFAYCGVFGSSALFRYIG